MSHAWKLSLPENEAKAFKLQVKPGLHNKTTSQRKGEGRQYFWTERQKERRKGRKRNTVSWAGEMPLLVMYLPHKHKDISPTPGIHVKKLGLVSACHSRAGDAVRRTCWPGNLE